MLDAVERLRTNPKLQQLLTHYADACADDREAWQDRLADLEGAGPRDLVLLHGELIAFGWVEQNTGNTPTGRPGTVAACYRITTAGRRALKQSRSTDTEDESEPVVAAGGAERAEEDGAAAPAPKRREGRKARLTPGKAAGAAEVAPAA
jgi:hypothetical protein